MEWHELPRVRAERAVTAEGARGREFWAAAEATASHGMPLDRERAVEIGVCRWRRRMRGALGAGGDARSCCRVSPSAVLIGRKIRISATQEQVSMIGAIWGDG